MDLQWSSTGLIVLCMQLMLIDLVYASSSRFRSPAVSSSHGAAYRLKASPKQFAAISSLQPGSSWKKFGLGNLSRVASISNTPAPVSSGAKYFSDLLKSSIGYNSIPHRCGYNDFCTHTKDAIDKAFPSVLSGYTASALKSLGSYSSLNSKDGSESLNSITETSRLLENAVYGAVLFYLETTENFTNDNRILSFFKFTKGLNDLNHQFRTTELVDLVSKLEGHLFSTFRNSVTACKLSFVSKLFNDASNRNTDLIKLTQVQFISNTQKEFMNTIPKLVPFFFKNSNYKSTDLETEGAFYKRLLWLIFTAIEYSNDKASTFLNHLSSLKFEHRLKDTLKRWSLDSDIDEFNNISNTLNSGAKAMLSSHIKGNIEKGKLMKLVTNKQHQIDLLQKQLGNSSQHSPLNCGFAYRLPNSNLNIAGSIQKGKGNLQISCVPDESAGLLGPYGFTHGVFPGNLGLSINIQI
ncbi:signal peptide containing protein [Theileria equi strain WA]|uniref:Signal peptide containing protein n=1 Tax=Theileria equi strain WA TaxID=1537102 RepID=L1LEN0_THEEQ|nr:signal peptide containing protein [Theileria equi strain WA]EKX73710.1 signal peptide containing protein [Theileria equi strain WA]|eukprot:XP_004833162.1 signal peptide containing protein [Theileria equi strain WA]